MGIPYRAETPTGWAAAIERTWKIEELPEGVRLYGICPTCNDPSETRVVAVAVAPGANTGAERKSVASDGKEPVLVVCDCEGGHDGGPPGQRGCGRAGYLNLVSDDA